MAPRRDRLERMFSRRRKDGAMLMSSLMGNRPVSSVTEIIDTDLLGSHSFPSPSFIKPTSTRMVARDEIIVTPRRVHRAQSLPEPPQEEQTPKPGHRPTKSESIVSPNVEVPARTSSLAKRREVLVASLLDFNFREKVGKCHSRSPSPAAPPSPHDAIESKQQPAQLQDALPIYASRNRPHTPPASDRDDSCILPSPNYLARLQIAPPSELTPESSPRLSPVQGPQLRRVSSTTQARRTNKHRSLESNSTAARLVMSPLRKAVSDSTLSGPYRDSLDHILREPSFTDFMNLNDDEVAEEEPLKPVAPPTPTTPDLSPISSSPADSRLARTPSPTARGHQLLTLSPPLASRPAATAAFEAARIAARHKFDLIYVVNLWPGHSALGHSHSASASSTLIGSPASPDNSTRALPTLHENAGDVGLPIGMTGRLLAAYGLQSLASPFRISAPVHLKILRTKGWIEYRSESTALDEFARAYGCSFYTGHMPDWKRRSAEQGRDDASKEPPSAPTPNNRGIIFAAYRMPRSDGTSLASSPAELAELYRDAEALVEMLIDVHMTHRNRRPSLATDCASQELPRTPTTSRSPLLA